MNKLLIASILNLALASASASPPNTNHFLLPGLSCLAPSYDPNFCLVRRNMVSALFSMDFATANNLDSNTKTLSASLFASAGLGMAVILGNFPLYSYLSDRVDPNIPTYMNAQVFLDFNYKLLTDPDLDTRTGFDFENEMAYAPAAQLAIAWNRVSIFRSLLAKRGTLDLAATDFRGNSVWHYVARFGRVEMAKLLPANSLRFEKNFQGLTPADIVDTNPELTHAQRVELQNLLSGNYRVGTRF